MLYLPVATALTLLNRRVPELLPTYPTLAPPEQVGQFRGTALPVSVADSASYDTHDPGDGVAVGLGVPVGVGVAPPGVTDTQAENSDVLPSESVAVAVIT